MRLLGPGLPAGLFPRQRFRAHVAAASLGEAVRCVKGLGADEVIDFEKGAFQAALKDYDAVFDTVGGETYRSSRR